jgi:hypothetical protein
MSTMKLLATALYVQMRKKMEAGWTRLPVLVIHMFDD